MPETEYYVEGSKIVLEKTGNNEMYNQQNHRIITSTLIFSIPICYKTQTDFPDQFVNHSNEQGHITGIDD